MERPSLVFIGLWFDFLWPSLEKYKIMSCKMKKFEDLKRLFLSFRLYFVIDIDNPSTFTVNYLFLTPKNIIFWHREHMHMGAELNFRKYMCY
jgi:hypothetical protein